MYSPTLVWIYWIKIYFIRVKFCILQLNSLAIIRINRVWESLL